MPHEVKIVLNQQKRGVEGRAGVNCQFFCPQVSHRSPTATKSGQPDLQQIIWRGQTAIYGTQRKETKACN